MAEDYTPDVLDRGSWDADLTRAGTDLVNRQNEINRELARIVNAGGTGLEDLQDQIDVINGQITTINTALTDLTDYDTLTVSSASSSTFIPKRFQTLEVTVSLGGGAFTYDLALGTSGAVAGNLFHLLVHSPAGAARVLRVRNATTGGTILVTMTSTAVARDWTGLFIFNGTAWVKYMFTTL